MNPVLGIAIFIILWWLVFFATLPFGARSFHEAGEAAPPGTDAGAPKVHGLLKKGVAAAGIAAILWLGVAWAITSDLFHVIPA